LEGVSFISEFLLTYNYAIRPYLDWLIGDVVELAIINVYESDMSKVEIRITLCYVQL
jgi:hypothetical protein